MFNPLQESRKSQVGSKEIVTDSYAIIPFHFMRKTTTVARVADVLVYVNGCSTFTQYDVDDVCKQWEVPEDVKDKAVKIANSLTRNIDFDDLVAVIKEAPTILSFYPEDTEFTFEQLIQLYNSNSGTLSSFTKAPSVLAEKIIHRWRGRKTRFRSLRIHQHILVDNIHNAPSAFDPEEYTEEQLLRITAKHPEIWTDIGFNQINWVNHIAWVNKNKRFLVLAVSIMPELVFSLKHRYKFSNYLKKVALKSDPTILFKLEPKHSFQMIALKANPQLIKFDTRLTNSTVFFPYEFDPRVIDYACRNYSTEYTEEMLNSLKALLPK